MCNILTSISVISSAIVYLDGGKCIYSKRIKKDSLIRSIYYIKFKGVILKFSGALPPDSHFLTPFTITEFYHTTLDACHSSPAPPLKIFQASLKWQLATHYPLRTQPVTRVLLLGTHIHESIKPCSHDTDKPRFSIG